MPETAAGERTGTPVDGVTVLGALSPSRAGDFKTCPLLYRYRVLDKLPERPSPAAVRGTVVHQVLEDLFELPAPERTPERAEAMIPDAWAAVREREPERSALFGGTDGTGGTGDTGAEESWLAGCAEVLRRYFDLEDPRRLEPAARELYVETLLDSRLLLRGYVDRVDVAPDGAVRVVDYKTASSPGVGLEARALFQMRFYALVLWRTRGVVPAVLRLLYLGNSEIISYQPDEHDLLATQRQVEALWAAVRHAHETGEWLPSRSSACRWCSFQAHCPEFGGTVLPLPGVGPEFGGEVLPLPSADQEPGQVLDADPDQGVDEDPSLPLEHRDVVGDHQDGAAGGLG